ncbi:hypothetical protein [Pseudomonas sp.]|uniref:hypothetical protein n=1 Tax=Pseudomonas sp. TaxID=306 RepID=UPI0026357272|nr:hypothetical protein [Pseudomonas sp.]
MSKKNIDTPPINSLSPAATQAAAPSEPRTARLARLETNGTRAISARAELAAICFGTSQVEASRRFSHPAWREHPSYRRLTRRG